MAKKFRFDTVFPPLTDEEDAAITAAALSDPDCPPLTDEELARMVPMHLLDTDWRRVLLGETSTVRLSADVVAFFRADGDDWQSRVNAVLERHIARARKRNAKSQK